jgi:protein tyrosine phosphatase (PTP) superfamily phosphohydrolase (DUF442 family)
MRSFSAVKRRLALFLVLALSGSLGIALGAELRPAVWATPVAGTTVTNLYRIEPDLYRSAQPDGAGFRELAALGVKTVLDLKGGDGDGDTARGTSLKLLHVPMTAFGLRDDRVLDALRILSDPTNRPLIVHCQQGADRTGALMALYRVVVQGWSKEDAVREMDEGGYHHSSLWSNLDRYVRAANVEALRKQLGSTLPISPNGQTLVAAASAPAAPASAPAAPSGSADTAAAAAITTQNP